MYFCVVLCIVCFVSFSVFFVCICVLNLPPPGGYPIAVKYITSYHINTAASNQPVILEMWNGKTLKQLYKQKKCTIERVGRKHWTWQQSLQHITNECDVWYTSFQI